MKSFSLIITLFFISNFGTLFAQTYTTGFDNTAEQEGWTQYRIGVEDPYYEWEYTTSEAHSDPNCILHYYPVGGTEVSDDWFVSPVFDFSEGGTIDSVWHHFAGFGLPMAGDTVAIYVIGGSPDPNQATSKTMLFNYVDTNYVNDATWTLNTNITIPNLSGESYLAFRYKTIINWLDVRFDDLSVTSNSTTNVEFLLLDHAKVEIYPNPTNGFLSIKTSKGMAINSKQIYDINGKLIKQFSNGTNQIDFNNLKSGQYFLKISTDEGYVVKKVIKH